MEAATAIPPSSPPLTRRKYYVVTYNYRKFGILGWLFRQRSQENRRSHYSDIVVTNIVEVVNE